MHVCCKHLQIQCAVNTNQYSLCSWLDLRIRIRSFLWSSLKKVLLISIIYSRLKTTPTLNKYSIKHSHLTKAVKEQSVRPSKLNKLTPNYVPFLIVLLFLKNEKLLNFTPSHHLISVGVLGKCHFMCNIQKIQHCNTEYDDLHYI